MADLSYLVRYDGGLWHWEVLTVRGRQLGHGATLARTSATTEAMVYATQPARDTEIEAIEVAERAEISHRAFAEAEQCWQVADNRLDQLTLLNDRTRALTLASQIAIVEARKMLARGRH